jgi:hypothetical protein
MIKFDKPINLNGTELIDELNAVGIAVEGRPKADETNLWLNIDAKDEAKAKTIVDAHDGTTVAPDKTVERQAILDRLGLTAEEAAILLG